MQYRFLGWVRVSVNRWIPAMLWDSQKRWASDIQVWAVHSDPEIAEETCRVLTSNWLALELKRKTIGLELCGGEVVALLAGTPPVIRRGKP